MLKPWNNSTVHYRKQPSPPSLLSSDLERREPELSLITDISLSITMERDVAAATE